MAKVVVISDFGKNRCRGRPSLGWMDGIRREGYVSGAVLNALGMRRQASIVRSE